MSFDTIDLVERAPHRPGVRPREVVLTAVVLALLVASFVLGRATSDASTLPAPAPHPSATAAAHQPPQGAGSAPHAVQEAPQNVGSTAQTVQEAPQNAGNVPQTVQPSA